MGCVLSTQPTIFDVSKCYQYSVILFYKNSNYALGGVRAVHVRDGGHSPLASSSTTTTTKKEAHKIF